MIRADAVGRAEAHAGAAAIGFPAAGEDLAFVEVARRRPVRVEREVHGLGVGLAGFAREIDRPFSLKCGGARERCARIGGGGAGRGGAGAEGENEGENW